MIELDISAAEALGRETISTGRLASYRETFTLSRTRLAQVLGTSTKVIAGWEENPDMGKRMHSMSAVKLGELIHELNQITGNLPVQVATLMPLPQLASRMGVSPNSSFLAAKCQTGELKCFSIGTLGTYVPREQAGLIILNRKAR
jgi:DNA-binding XRE family transcriptional regulator